MPFLFVAIGGALGAACRYKVTSLFEKNNSFYATFLINSVGSFFMGICVELIRHETASYYLITVGFLGAFTTFSTFAFDAVKMIEQHRIRSCIFYLFSTVFIGMIALVCGMKIVDVFIFN